MSSSDVMDTFEIEIDEQSRIGSEYMAHVVNEIRRALAEEKAKRKLTQQDIADTIGTSRAVVNRQVQGYENLTARRTAELLWAIGWEPYFEARPVARGNNEHVPPLPKAPREPDPGNSKPQASALDGKKDQKESAAGAAYAQ